MDANNARYSTTDELDLCRIKIFLGGREEEEKDAWRVVVGVIKGSFQKHLKTGGG